MDSYETYKEANRALWNEWTVIHEKSAFYDVEGFKSGNLTLKAIELDELGEVTGKSLLHLQCHFGLDTLSWARLGANVTGVDFSNTAIALAQSLSQELGLNADFVCADVYDLPGILSGEFDIVFTSYGVLCWLPDLSRWATIIVHFLKPGATFYIVEDHPVANIFDDAPDTANLKVAYPYFDAPAPSVINTQGSYADRSACVSQPVCYEWHHSLGDVVTALSSAGMRIEFLHEFSFCNYAKFPFMERGEDGWWRLKSLNTSIPLLFSLKATKESWRE